MIRKHPEAVAIALLLILLPAVCALRSVRQPTFAVYPLTQQIRVNQEMIRVQTEAEAARMRAEAERFRAEGEKMRSEMEKLPAKAISFEPRWKGFVGKGSGCAINSTASRNPYASACASGSIGSL